MIWRYCFTAPDTWTPIPEDDPEEFWREGENDEQMMNRHGYLQWETIGDEYALAGFSLWVADDEEQAPERYRALLSLPGEYIILVHSLQAPHRMRYVRPVGTVAPLLSGWASHPNRSIDPWTV